MERLDLLRKGRVAVTDKLPEGAFGDVRSAAATIGLLLGTPRAAGVTNGRYAEL